MTTVGIKTPGSLAAASCRWCRDTDVLAIAGHFDLQAFPHEVRVVHHTQDIDLIDVPPKRSRMVKVSSWDGHFFIIGFTWEIHQNQLLQLSDVYIMLSSPSHVLYKPVSSTQLNQSLAKVQAAGTTALSITRLDCPGARGCLCRGSTPPAMPKVSASSVLDVSNFRTNGNPKPMGKAWASDFSRFGVSQVSKVIWKSVKWFGEIDWYLEQK